MKDELSRPTAAMKGVHPDDASTHRVQSCDEVGNCRDSSR
jgi:hypothetical protein